MEIKKAFSKLPAVLGIQKSLILTDALFKNVYDDGTTSDLYVYRTKVLGTQNVVDKTDNVMNIQEIEVAKTDKNAVKTRVSFEIRGANVFENISVCSNLYSKASPKAKKGEDVVEETTENTETTESKTKEKKIVEKTAKELKTIFAEFYEKAINNKALNQVCYRYARNILNGRWLWRNRIYSNNITIQVFELDQLSEKLIITIDNAKKLPLNHFNDFTTEEIMLGDLLAEGFAGKNFKGYKVVADIDFGISGTLEVYPSQNYRDSDKNKSKNSNVLSKSLYKIPLADNKNNDLDNYECMGIAAFRDQKISNAIRTIDDYYNSFEEFEVIAPVEPSGANKELNMFLRAGSDSGFDILKKIELLDYKKDEKEFCFLLAMLIRGGVFGEADK